MESPQKVCESRPHLKNFPVTAQKSVPNTSFCMTRLANTQPGLSRATAVSDKGLSEVERGLDYISVVVFEALGILQSCNNDKAGL